MGALRVLMHSYSSVCYDLGFYEQTRVEAAGHTDPPVRELFGDKKNNLKISDKTVTVNCNSLGMLLNFLLFCSFVLTLLDSLTE